MAVVVLLLLALGMTHAQVLLHKKKLLQWKMAHVVPTVVGPDGLYITDRHHASKAVLQADFSHFHHPEKHRNMYACITQNWHTQSVNNFYGLMEQNHLIWTYSARGVPTTPDKLPQVMNDLGDDPYRDLSRYVRDGHGYIKCGKPGTSSLPNCNSGQEPPFFLEMMWANFLRSALPIPSIYALSLAGQRDALVDNLELAMRIALAPSANKMAGWNNSTKVQKPQVVQVNKHGCDKQPSW